MIAAATRLVDQLLGRGDAATTVPPLDGQLKPNQLLETAPVIAEFDSPEDLATDGKSVFVANGATVLRLDGARSVEMARFDRPITALCCLRVGGLAVALEGRDVRVIGGAFDGKRWHQADGRPFNAVNAIAQGADDRTLIVTDGSATQSFERWCYDLMERGQSGRVMALDLTTGAEHVVADGLAYAFGACVAANELWVCESWRHRIVAVKGPSRRTVLGHLPVYPSRLSPAAGGDYWLTAFIARTQLVEFVLRETAYRRRMMREIDPRYWIAPRLSSGRTFLEPMQGAHIKTMGILKPWAPPRSYGLVIKLSQEGLPRYSLHSRVDGSHHGVVAAVECSGELFVLAKGCGKVLRLKVAELERDAPE